jgi:hypothetical protein
MEWGIPRRATEREGRVSANANTDSQERASREKGRVHVWNWPGWWGADSKTLPRLCGGPSRSGSLRKRQLLDGARRCGSHSEHGTVIQFAEHSAMAPKVWLTWAVETNEGLVMGSGTVTRGLGSEWISNGHQLTKIQ